MIFFIFLLLNIFLTGINLVFTNILFIFFVFSYFFLDFSYTDYVLLGSCILVFPLSLSLVGSLLDSVNYKKSIYYGPLFLLVGAIVLLNDYNLIKWIVPNESDTVPTLINLFSDLFYSGGKISLVFLLVIISLEIPFLILGKFSEIFSSKSDVSLIYILRPLVVIFILGFTLNHIIDFFQI